MNTNEYAKKMSAVNNGFLHIFLNVLMAAAFTACIIWMANWDCMVDADHPDGTAWVAVPIVSGLLLFFIYLMHCVGFITVQPNQSRVLTFFGKYSGTVFDNGFFWVNPFYGKRKVSMRARNMDVAPIKVNDKNGNPIMIGLVLVWKIKDTYKACFNIDVETIATAQNTTNQQTLKGYDSFVSVQSDAALRKVAGLYAYDNMDNKFADEVTLRSGGEEINTRLEQELRSHLSIAGIEVVEARINYLAYAAEIAQVMLRRQQADAIISAREKIVEGAVSMVQLALDKLQKDGVVDLDEEKKAAMVSNLLVVLCADESASPVINAGTLYQ